MASSAGGISGAGGRGDRKHRQPLASLSGWVGAKARKTSARAGPSRKRVLAAEAAAREAAEAPAVPPGVVDLYRLHAEDPQLVATYANDIYTYFRRREEAVQVDPGFLSRQPRITPNNLAVLHDWLVQVHHKFDLQLETLFITSAVLVRFLSRVVVSRSKLQLYGVTAMLLASKYEDMYPPFIKDFAYMTANAYTPRQIVRAELEMLEALEYSLEQPLALQFLQRFVHATRADAVVHEISKYLLELCMVHGSMIRFCPSLQALAAIVLAHRIKVGASPWSPSLAHYSGYAEAEVEPAERSLAEILRQSKVSELQAVRKKYLRDDKLCVAGRDDVEKFVIEPE